MIKAEVINQSDKAYNVHDLFKGDVDGPANFSPHQTDLGKIWTRNIIFWFWRLYNPEYISNRAILLQFQYQLIIMEMR